MSYVYRLLTSDDKNKILQDLDRINEVDKKKMNCLQGVTT